MQYTIETPFFEYNTRRYIIVTPDNSTEKIRVKIPFRYNRVMCQVRGDKTIQELVIGDTVTIKIKNCGRWEVNGYTGICYKCEELQYLPRNE